MKARVKEWVRELNLETDCLISTPISSVKNVFFD